MTMITAELLESLNACSAWLRKFNECFPNGVEVDFSSRDDVKMAIDAGFVKVLWFLYQETGERKYQVTVDGIDLCGIDLRWANLSGADLSGVDLTGVDLTGANLRGVNLRGVNLRGADLRMADLTKANLRGVNLRGVNLRGADLRMADLTKANLRGANLSWARYDAETTWPNGFDPAYAGVVRV